MSTNDPPPRAYPPQYLTIEVAGDMLCSWCFQPAGPHISLKRCSLCCRVSYCSTACQKRDWKDRHKSYCPRFQDVNKYDHEIVEGSTSSMTLSKLVEHQEKRRDILKSSSPNQHEPCEDCSTTILKHEVVCEVCYKTPYQARPIKFFASCAKCQLARYCDSDGCRDKFPTVHSKEQCDMLALLHTTERTEIDYFLARKRFSRLTGLQTPSPNKRTAYASMDSYTGWDQYDLELSREFNDTADISVMYAQLAGSFQSHSPQAAAGVAQISTESKSFPFTIIAGLERVIPRVQTSTSLEIHVVGASCRERALKGLTEEILHHFPKLKKLHLRFIGPEAELPNAPDTQTGNRACVECRAVGAQRILTNHTELYHDFLRKDPSANNPDLVVCLNSGHSDITLIHSWARTLDRILDLNVPAIFTQYSEQEGEIEVDVLATRGARFVFQLEENKWRGVIPIINRAIMRDHGGPVYSNYFWYALHGRV